MKEGTTSRKIFHTNVKVKDILPTWEYNVREATMKRENTLGQLKNIARDRMAYNKWLNTLNTMRYNGRRNLRKIHIHQ